ncbi:MAG: glycosyltransferase family 1 protein [Acidobacteriota bacterium]
MRIAVVAYEMEGDRTGVGRYLEGLLAGIADCPGDDTWRLYFKGDPFEHPLWQRERTDGPRFEPIFDRRPEARPILWEQWRLPRLLRRDRPDLIFSPAYSLPTGGGAPGVVTVHDLSFELLGDEFPRKERWRRRLLARRAARRARRILTDREEIGRDLMRVYKVPYEKIAVVPLGIDERFFDTTGASADDESLARHGITAPFLLYLGSILERRHIERIIQAFAQIAPDHPAVTLVIAGRNRLRRRDDLRHWIEASGVDKSIVRLGYVPEEDLLPLYRRATLSYYLSTYEGYGLPPLESLAAGTPVVASRGLALDDLWPDYPYRAMTLDASTIARVTGAALRDDERRRQVAQEGAERMAKLDWRHAAERFLSEIRRA